MDDYVLGVDQPITETKGVCIAVIHRTDDDDDKLIVVPDNGLSFEEISRAWPTSLVEKLTEFQEKWFKHVILRNKI